MDILLTYESALEALRRYDPRSPLSLAERPSATVPSNPPGLGEMRALIARDHVLRGLSAPIHLLVSGGRARTRSKLVTAHLQSAPLPPGSLVRLSPSVLCVSPECLAVLMAPRLTHLELVVLLSELMGNYSIDPSVEDGMTQRDHPLMTPESLLSYLDELGSRPGTRSVRRALKDACVGSGSPRETKLSMRMALKPALGGHSLHVLSMNEPLEVRRIHDRMRTGVRRPDILIGRRDESGSVRRRRIVAVEYHGGRHDAPERLAQDAVRSNELKAIGIGEYIVRREQYCDVDYINGLAEAIRRELGEAPRRITNAERERRRRASIELYEELELIDGIHWNGRARAKNRAAEKNAAVETPPYEVVPVEAYGLA